MNWYQLLQDNTITNANELQNRLMLSASEIEKMDKIQERFPLRIPEYYLNLINWDDPNDPIRKLCIPDVNNFDLTLAGSLDQSGESSNTKLKGLQHKYRQTALIISTSQCAMYCRHCFRKRLVGNDMKDESSHDVKAQAAYIKDHPEINNVLVSGGDAFLNSNAIIENYLREMSALPNIQFIRFGTRTPVVFPMRITMDSELLDLLEHYAKIKPIYVITHFNHIREITEESKQAIQALRSRGVIVRNQTVLLKGINDNGQKLGELLSALCSIGVIPYYVFQCRPVAGVKQSFQVPILKGIDIVNEARSMQNGQGKSFRYAMSHVTGKIEIVGKTHEDELILRYHQAKDEKMLNHIFSQKFTSDQSWLEDNLEGI